MIRITDLTERQLKILSYAAQGKTQVEMANLLNVAIVTVYNEIDKMKFTYMARNITHLVALAYEAGILGQENE